MRIAKGVGREGKAEVSREGEGEESEFRKTGNNVACFSRAHHPPVDSHCGRCPRASEGYRLHGVGGRAVCLEAICFSESIQYICADSV